MKLQNEFNHYLADLGVMIFKLHNIHWNVEGLQFVSIHEFTEAAYDKLFEYFDAVAEHQKIYGYTPDSKLSDYLAKAQIKEIEPKQFSPTESLEIVQADFELLRKEATDLRNAADKEGWFSAVSLLEGHVEYYNKQLWFMRAILAK